MVEQRKVFGSFWGSSGEGDGEGQKGKELLYEEEVEKAKEKLVKQICYLEISVAARPLGKVILTPKRRPSLNPDPRR